MAVYFFDSSSIVKRYVKEKGTGWITGILDPVVGSIVYAVRIAGVEVISAIARRGRGGSLSAKDTANAIGQFRREFTGIYRIIEVTPALILQAMRLAEIHALRGYDAIQLAAALEVNTLCPSLGLSAVTLVSADTELNTAAMAEGLTVEDPNTHP
jgi:hypothetical protein